MNLHSTWMVCLGMLAVTAGCKPKEQPVTTTASEQATSWVKPSAKEHATAGTLLVGKITEVLAPTNQYEARNPCGTVSCQATVRVEKVVRKGNDAVALLEVGNEVTVYFRYTLAPAREGYIVNLNVDYPGLKSGDRFEAVMTSRPQVGSGQLYVVEHYLKLE